VEAMDSEAGAAVAAMRPLDPNQLRVLRFRTVVTAFIFLGIAVAADLWPLRESVVPLGIVPGVVALLGLAATLILPRRRYRAWGYAEGEDELHIRQGLLFRARTVVPFVRVQHIDIAQGPVERRYGVARLILHTAGTRSAAIPLPGLAHADAEAIRDRIRAQMRQDLM
jgi:uncharacterized protein